MEKPKKLGVRLVLQWCEVETMDVVQWGGWCCTAASDGRKVVVSGGGSGGEWIGAVGMQVRCEGRHWNRREMMGKREKYLK
jgi:hypothetical protein